MNTRENIQMITELDEWSPSPLRLHHSVTFYAARSVEFFLGDHFQPPGLSELFGQNNVLNES